MKISKSFQGKVFGDYVKEMYSHSYLRIPFLRWEDNKELIITKENEYCDEDTLRWYLKIFDTKYPKYENGEPYSFKDVDSKTIINHLEYYRLVLAHNGLWFKSDEEEWDRIKESYK